MEFKNLPGSRSFGIFQVELTNKHEIPSDVEGERLAQVSEQIQENVEIFLQTLQTGSKDFTFYVR